MNKSELWKSKSDKEINVFMMTMAAYLYDMCNLERPEMLPKLTRHAYKEFKKFTGRDPANYLSQATDD